MSLETNEKTTDARQASMSRVQTQDTLMASLAPPASVEPETKPEDKPAAGDQKPSKKSAQERIVELVHKSRKAEAKAEDAAKRAEELEARLKALETQAKPIEVSDKPQRSQYASEEDYTEALTDWKAERRIAQREQEQAAARAQAEQAEVAQQWDKRQQKVSESIPDYAEVLAKSEVVIPPYVHQALLESESGPEIAYYLALHPEEAKRLAALKPLAAMKRIVSLEANLAGNDDDATPEKKVSETPKQSKAPPPITPVRSTASANPGPAQSYEEYKRRRQGK